MRQPIAEVVRPRSLAPLAALAAAAPFAPSMAASALPAPAAKAAVEHVGACPAPAAGEAQCFARVVTRRGSTTPAASTVPLGAYGPDDVTAAYRYPKTTDSARVAWSTTSLPGSSRTIAIVDAYDAPNAEKDLEVFSAQFGLPACTTANGCFTKVNQTGGRKMPRTDAGWALEIALDVQWAHAVAPGARIVLVEAASNSYTNLMTAERYAVANADFVSNSWGSGEFSGEASYDVNFVGARAKGVFVAAGDNGTPAGYPSSSPSVISVGGTNLQRPAVATSDWAETGWSRGGGGCSLYETATDAQLSTSAALCGSKRATPDLSLVADPATGVAVYDSTPYQGSSGWMTIGGTSAATPMVAARAATIIPVGSKFDAALVYGSTLPYRDVTSGNNGAACAVGFDLCTGRGSLLGP